MKKFIIILITALLSMTAFAQTQSYTREGNTFSVSSKSSIQIVTPFTWKDAKDNVYPVYMTSTGRAYILKMSTKTGKEYKSYLPEDVSRTMAKELGVEYKEKEVKKPAVNTTVSYKLGGKPTVSIRG